MTLHLTHTLMLLCVTAAQGQTLISGEHPGAPVHLISSDAAVLESRGPRSDFSCALNTVTPRLEFDLRFHSGYTVELSLRDFVGSGNRLTAIFRVAEEDQPEEPVYFSQQWTVPAIQEDAKGTVELEGSFVLGEGRYQVEWLLRDSVERVCSGQWRLTVNPRGRDKQVRLSLPRGSVGPESQDPYFDEAPVKRERAPLKVLVLFHAAPETTRAVTMRKTETLALLGMLRQIAQEPRIGSYSLVAFNLEQGSVLYRARDTTQIDFRALGDALRQLHLGTVDVQNLAAKERAPEFLGRLLREEIARSRPDALVFVGPRTFDSTAINRSVKDLGEPITPVFYLNYTADPRLNPWRDLIGSLVRFWKGTEYTISRPPDMFQAWTAVMSRIAHKPVSVDLTNPALVETDLIPKK